MISRGISNKLDTFPELLQTVQTLELAYLSGEYLRDILLDRKSDRLAEISTPLTIKEIKAKLPNRLVFVDERRGVCRHHRGIVIRSMNYLEFRNGYPTRVFTEDPKEDARHRDFTVNSLFYDALTDQLLDFYDAEKDLRECVIRFVDDSVQRLREDKARILKLFKLLAILGKDWKPDISSYLAISDFPLQVGLVTSDAIRKELWEVMTQADAPSIFFRYLEQSGTLVHVFPELYHAIGLTQSNKAVGLDLFDHLMYAIDSVPKRKVRIRFAALLHDIAKPYTKIIDRKGDLHFYGHDRVGAFKAEGILFRLRFPKAFVKGVSHLIRHHLFDASPRLSVGSLRKLIHKVGPDNIYDLLDLREADRYGTGRPDISMYKVDLMRRKVGRELRTITINSRNLEISNIQINRIVQPKPGEDVSGIGRQYLLDQVKKKRTRNTNYELINRLENLMRRNCPYGNVYLLDVQCRVLENTAERFEDGKLQCGVFCGWKCRE